MRVLFGCLAVLIFCSSCSQNTGERFERLAILPPEILIDDAASQWMVAALAIVWEEDLSTAPRMVVNVVRDASTASEFGATEVLRTTVENRNGRLRIEGTVTDAATQRNREVFEIEGNMSAGVLPAANAFAKRLDSSATGFSTKSERALEEFTRALQATTSADRVQALKGAIGLDSGFGIAYIILAQTDPQNLTELLTQAGARKQSFTALDRAKFNALAAQAIHAPAPQQEAALGALLQLAPNAGDALAGLGSLRFLEGDAVNGERLLGRALEVSPGNANIRQQLARGLIETKQFTKAEKVLAGLDTNPAILPTLATCVLLEGDARRSQAISDRFSQSLQPQVQGLYRAAWLALSGNAAGAVAALDKPNIPNANLADANLQSAAVAELVIWRLMQGDFAGAKQTVAVAPATPGVFTPQTLLLVKADAPLEEWQETVQESQITADGKESVLAYGLFLAGHYAEAAITWQRLLDRSGGTDPRARAMLAGSLNRAGKTAAAGKILVRPFVPEFGDLYAAISFGEMRRLLKL